MASESIHTGSELTKKRSVEIGLFKSIIVEADQTLLREICDVAAGRGHDVRPAASVAEALDLLRSEGGNFILLRLNHTNFEEIAAFLKTVASLAALNHLFLIALVDEEDAQGHVAAWLKMGFDDFVTTGSAGTQINRPLLANRLAIAERHYEMGQRQIAENSKAGMQSEKYLELFKRNPLAMILATSKDGFVIEANPSAESLLGQSRNDIINRYLSLSLPDIFDRPDFDPQSLGLFESLQLSEIPMRRSDQQRRWLEATVTLIEWPPSQAILICLHDVTAQKEREQRRILENRQESGGHVLQGLGKQMSDSITKIAGNLELLGRLPSTRMETRELLAAALAGVKEVEDLNRKSVSLGRRHQAQDLKKRIVGLKPLLEKTVSFALLGGKSRPVIYTSDDLWPVEVDESALTEAIQQIIVNADQSMPEGGTIFVDARNIRAANKGDEPACVCLRFRDQGCGIVPENRARIFDPFFSTTDRPGMGLPLAAAVLRAHGGRLALDSNPGEGTTVSLFIPVNIKLILQGSSATNLSGKLPPLGAGTARETRPRVLFMDDDAQIRELVQKILASHGFDIYCTKDGQEAIDAYRKAREFGAPFDVILMDLDVRGGMGGIEATERIRAEHPQLKAILTTGYIDDALLDSHREHGFLGVILKPFQIERLVGVVGKLAGVNP